MKLTVIFCLALTACWAQHRRSRINDGRYYFGKNPPKLTNQRPRNSVAYTGSNPPLERVQNTYNLENLNLIRRSSIRTGTTPKPAATARKKLRVVIRRRGNHRPGVYKDGKYNQRVRYKLQGTGAQDKYRLVDSHLEDGNQHKGSGPRLKNSRNWNLDKSPSRSHQAGSYRSNNVIPILEGNVQYRQKSYEQYKESYPITLKLSDEVEDTTKTNGRRIKSEGHPGVIESSRESSFSGQIEDSSKRYKQARKYITNRFDSSGSGEQKYELSLELQPPWKPDETSIRNKESKSSDKMTCSEENFGSSGEGYGDKDSAILRKVQELEGGGGYHFEYKTENRICGEERRTPVSSPNESEASQGYYQYTGPDNVVYRVDYRAGKEGFVPVGAHLPTPPPVPLAILRALEYQKNYKIQN